MFYCPLFRIIYHLRIYKSNHIFSQILGDSLGARRFVKDFGLNLL